jgi:hypothetical protein
MARRPELKKLIWDFLDAKRDAHVGHMIPYRPEFRELTGGNLLAAILLEQIWFYHNRQDGKPFYKFIEPCSHPDYRVGDAWTECLNCSVDEFRTAIKMLAVKVTTGTKKQALYEQSLVIYWTDSDRVTWWQLNPRNFGRALYYLYSSKVIGTPNVEFLLGKLALAIYQGDGETILSDKQVGPPFLFSKKNSESSSKETSHWPVASATSLSLNALNTEKTPTSSGQNGESRSTGHSKTEKTITRKSVLETTLEGGLTGEAFERDPLGPLLVSLSTRKERRLTASEVKRLSMPTVPVYIESCRQTIFFPGPYQLITGDLKDEFERFIRALAECLTSYDRRTSSMSKLVRAVTDYNRKDGWLVWAKERNLNLGVVIPEVAFPAAMFYPPLLTPAFLNNIPAEGDVQRNPALTSPKFLAGWDN